MTPLYLLTCTCVTGNQRGGRQESTIHGFCRGQATGLRPRASHTNGSEARRGTDPTGNTHGYSSATLVEVGAASHKAVFQLPYEYQAHLSVGQEGAAAAYEAALSANTSDTTQKNTVLLAPSEQGEQ